MGKKGAKLLPPSSRKAPEPVPQSPEPPVGEIVTADYLYYLVEKLRPKDSVIAQESLSTLAQLRNRIPTTEPRSFFSMFSGVLGYGLPAAVGVGRRSVISGQSVRSSVLSAMARRNM